MPANDGADEKFEDDLRHDLPRGVDMPPQALGRERGLLSRWLAEDEMVDEPWLSKGGLMLGTRSGRVIGWKDDRHLLTIAGSRAGKGASLIIPNLIFYEGSAVVIDPKGENARITAGRRGKGTKAGGPGLDQEVYVLDPFGESGLLKTHSFNPLQGLDPESPDLIDDMGLFADALIMHSEHGEKHWSESAQNVIRALILMVVIDPLFKQRRHLLTVRALLMLNDPAIVALVNANDDEEIKPEGALIRLLLDQQHRTYGHVCTGTGEQLSAMGNKERGSVLSSARTQTQWLDRPNDEVRACQERLQYLRPQTQEDDNLSMPSGHAHGDAFTLAAVDGDVGAQCHGARERKAGTSSAVRPR